MSVEDFIETIRSLTGGAPAHEALVPGKMIRFATSDRRGDLSGWCKLFDDEEGGVYGCWRQGISEDWLARTVRNAEEQASFQVRVNQAKAEAARIEAEIRTRCREKSTRLWDKGLDVDMKHPYLAAKEVRPFGIRQLRESLLVPVRDTQGTLHGLQFIMPDGTKRFKSGTAVSGCYHAIGKANGKILIAEGFATGATLHEITGHAVACAFSAGNLKPVAVVLRENYPETTLIICADDDHLTDGNPGLTKATEATRSVGGLLAIPRFPATRKDNDTDFNDLAKLAGREAITACIEAAAMPNDEIPSPVETENPGYPLDAVIQRLSKLSPLQYDQVRKQEAKALAGIGHVADTLMDRAIIFELRRKLPHEEVERIRYAEPGLFDVLRSKLARFAEDYSDQVRQARPPLPHSLNDRAQDNWEPLLAIALAAGGEWLQLGTTAALKLAGSESVAQTVGTELLADIREIFGDDRDRITTAELIRLLCSDEEKPWATYNRGNSISPRQVARRLKE